MEFQNKNIDNNAIDNNKQNKLAYVCDCGCEFSFLRGENLGFKLNVIDEDAVLSEDKLIMDWFAYIPIALIHTWGELMDFITDSRRDQPNEKVWYHLEPYTRDRHDFADDTSVEFIYIN